MLASFNIVGTKQPSDLPTKELLLQTGFFALVDEEDYDRLKNYHWFAKLYHASFYAVAKRKWNGKDRLLKMHRLVAHTPVDMVTHHINHKTLDNRKCNLLNMFPREHTKLHFDNRILVKFEK